MGITVRGSRSGATTARAWKSKQGTTIGSKDRSGARGTGSGVGGKVLPFDYAETHARGFGITQPESLSEGLANMYGGSAGSIIDRDTGAIIVYDSDEDEALLIEPAGGLSSEEKKRIIADVNRTGDIPNIGESIIGEQTPQGQPKTGGGWNIFAPTMESDYEEGSLSTSTGGFGGGTLSKGILLVAGAVIVALVLLFGGRK